MILDHIGIVVPDIDQAITQWRDQFGYRQQTAVVVNTRQLVQVVFMVADSPVSVKLVAPTDVASPVHGLARRGGGLHHLCFRAASLDGEITRLRSLGVRLVAPPQPGEAFDNELIAFVYAGNGLNIELIETVKRAGILAT